jgi:hypothetical protein
MKTFGPVIARRIVGLLMLAAVGAATGALGSGDLPPEAKHSLPKGASANPDTKADASAESARATASASRGTVEQAADSASGQGRPEPRFARYGTGYEIRQGLVRGPGRGGGRGR